MPEVTQLLNSICRGHEDANDSLIAVVYDELRTIADLQFASESRGHTLQPTALVNEAFLRLIGPKSRREDRGENGSWESRAHFYGAAAEAMRRILVDHARKKKSQKRGGNAKRTSGVGELGEKRVTNLEEILEVHEVLEQFEQSHAEKARLVKLRYFAGMTIPQAARVMGISVATANRYWAFSRAWLFDRIRNED